MSAVDTQLADALAAILRTYEVSSSESHLALYRKLGEAGWWDFFDLGLSDGGEIGVEEALLAGETLGRFVITPDILATMGFLVPLLGRLADKGPMSGKLRERLDAGECLCVALPNVGEPLRGRRIDHNVRLFGPLERVVGKNPKCALVPIQLDDERAFAAVVTRVSGAR